MEQIDYFLQDNKNLERLKHEYDKYGSITVGFDFDDTVHDYHGRGTKFDMVVSLLRDLKKLNCKLVCWTAHNNHDYVNNYLYEHKIPFDGINTDGVPLSWETRKPFFNALLDDRAGLKQAYEELVALVDYVKNKGE